jgi:hypothetical protein
MIEKSTQCVAKQMWIEESSRLVRGHESSLKSEESTPRPDQGGSDRHRPAKTGRWKVVLGVPRDDPSQPQLPKLEMGLLVIAPFDCPYKDSVLTSSTASVISP